jgi:hypothetical protein
MGTASNRKKARREATRSRPALERKLADQQELLDMCGTAYDAGRRVAAYPLAVSIRVMVHQTPASHSLLTLLGLQDTMTFADTAWHMDPRNLLPAHPGLSVIEATMGVGSSWVPRHSADADQVNPAVKFAEWWNAVILRDTTGRTWTRRRIVLELANKEGGAHVDPSQPVDLRALEDDNSMGWTHSDPIVGDQQSMLNGPLLPSVRQIAYELQLSVSLRRGRRAGAESPP